MYRKSTLLSDKIRFPCQRQKNLKYRPVGLKFFEEAAQAASFLIFKLEHFKGNLF